MSTIHNYEHIVSISYTEKSVSGDYRFYPEEKDWFGKVIREAGWYDSASYIFERGPLNLKGLSEEYMYEDNKIWEKAKVKVYLADGRSFRKFFNTNEEALVYVKYLKNKVGPEKFIQ